MNDTSDNTPSSRRALIRALKSGRAVLVLGTGVTCALSSDTRVESWKKLLQSALPYLLEISLSKHETITSMLSAASDPEDYALVAGSIEKTLGGNYARWLDATFKDLRVENAALGKALIALGCPVFTTNYDKLVEQATGRGSTDWTNSSSMLRVLRGETNDIAHIHGIWDRTESIIFSDVSYAKILNNNAARAILETMFTGYSIIFVGVGEGLDDPNFGFASQSYLKNFSDVLHSHFQLVKSPLPDGSSSLDAICKVPYGDNHEDLVPFLKGLKRDVEASGRDLPTVSRNELLRLLREDSLLWRSRTEVAQKSFEQLIFPPVFLKAPQSQDDLRENSVPTVRDSRVIEVDELISAGGTLVITGDEHSGLTTALQYLAFKAAERQPDSMAVFIPPLNIRLGPHPVMKAIGSQEAKWGVKPGTITGTGKAILALDDVVDTNPLRFDRTLKDLKSIKASLKIIGTTNASIPKMLAVLGVEDVVIVELGRLTEKEISDVVDRVSDSEDPAISRRIAMISRTQHLPRTPANVALLAELMISGDHGSLESLSEHELLMQFVELLLQDEFFDVGQLFGVTPRQKFQVLEELAIWMLLNGRDSVPEDQIIPILTRLFSTLGWDMEAGRVLADLVDRRVLRIAGPTESHTDAGLLESGSPDEQARVYIFQRAAYFELVAGSAAMNQPDIKKRIVEDPLDFAPVLRAYAALSRRDESLLEVASKLLETLPPIDVDSAVLAQREKVLLSDEGDSGPLEAASEEVETSLIGRGESTGGESGERHPDLAQTLAEYERDPSMESEPSIFLEDPVENWTSRELYTRVMDLASRLIRDSDFSTQQELKRESLRKALSGWVNFMVHLEDDLRASTPRALLDAIRDASSLYLEDVGDERGESKADIEELFFQVIPEFALLGGIASAFSSPTQKLALQRVLSEDKDLAGEEIVIGCLALMLSGGENWTAILPLVPDEVLSTHFGGIFFADYVNGMYVANQNLSEAASRHIKDFLWRAHGGRYYIPPQRLAAVRDKWLRDVEWQRATLQKRSPGNGAF